MSITTEDIRKAFNREMSTADIYFPIRAGEEKLDVEDFLLWYLWESFRVGEPPLFADLLSQFEAHPFSWLKPQHYPSQWSELKNTHPFGVPVMGKLPEIKEETKFVAIVGSREASQEALEVASNVARSLGEKAIIVSGGASGVDTAAHKATVNTVAVTALSPLVARENKTLSEVLGKGGCVICTVPPLVGAKLSLDEKKSEMLARNNWVALLGDFTVVASAKMGSSTMVEVDYALKANRRVFFASSVITEEFAEFLENAPRDSHGEKLVEVFSDIEDLKAKTSQWNSVWWL